MQMCFKKLSSAFLFSDFPLDQVIIFLELIQNSDFFCMTDAMDDIVALSWEDEELESQKRLVFRFGTPEKEIKDKLYERDLVLEFEQKVVYEN